MDTTSSTHHERGREQARVQLQLHGARRLAQLTERVALYGIADRAIVTRHAEFWRGFTAEADALTALGSRRAPRG